MLVDAHLSCRLLPLLTSGKGHMQFDRDVGFPAMPSLCSALVEPAVGIAELGIYPKIGHYTSHVMRGN